MLKAFDLNRKIKSLKVQSVNATYRLFYHLQQTLTKGYKCENKKVFVMHRNWKPDLRRCDKNDSEHIVQNYKLLSYNILAQDLLVEHLHLYYDIDREMLRWGSRLNKLREEITTLDPDILCLQEMQYDHLKELVNQINTTKQSRKLEYVFKKKTGTRSDGCAIIYDKNKFKLITERFVEYYTDGVPTLNRENIAIIVKFELLDESSAKFIVSTTHLLYNPRREDVRISQVNKLIQAIIEFSDDSELFDTKIRLPVILTGDFNFTPDTRAFQILTALRKPAMQSENSRNTQHDDYFQMEAIDFGTVNASTYQNRWIIVDYILTSRSQSKKSSIQINSSYQLPLVDQCWKNGKIPNKFVGSDHFSLAIQFTILTSK